MLRPEEWLSLFLSGDEEKGAFFPPFGPYITYKGIEGGKY